MAGNPQVSQGTLNRIRGAVNFNANPGLNITAPYLGREGISIAFDANFGQRIGAMTGGVSSPDAYVMATVTIHLLKSQSFSAVWKAQVELINTVGDITVKADSATLPDYTFKNCMVLRADPGPINGTSADYVVVLQGDYLVNSQLFDQ